MKQQLPTPHVADLDLPARQSSHLQVLAAFASSAVCVGLAAFSFPLLLPVLPPLPLQLPLVPQVTFHGKRTSHGKAWMAKTAADMLQGA